MTLLPSDMDTKHYNNTTSWSLNGPPAAHKKSSDSFPRFLGSRSGTLFSRHDKKWRWWHYLSLLIFLMALLEAVALVTGYTVLQSQGTPVRIALRQYRPILYKHLDSTALAPFPTGATVFHVTKEFGPAVATSTGITVTALAAAQQRTGLTDVRIVMPYYSFLKKKYPMDKVADLVIDLKDNKGKLLPMEVKVWKMMHSFVPVPPPPPETTVWQMVNGVNTSVTVTPPYEPKPIPATEQVPIYLISAGNRRPFLNAFRVKDPAEIHSSATAGLPREWENQYFSKAAAAFLTHQATAADEESLFAPIRKAPHIDIIHIHGADNAYVAKHLHEKRLSDQLGPQPPSIVFTMHSFLDELAFTVSRNNVRKFIEGSDAHLQPYVHDKRVFLAGIGIDFANVVTVPSRSMATDIVEGRSDDYLKELMMENVLQKARSRRFFGISNGFDAQEFSPFTDERLVARHLAFPRYALDLIERQPPLVHDSEAIASLWPLSAFPNDYITTSKDRAKRFLVRRGLLTEDDLQRPLVVYVGPLRRDRGVEMFEEAAALFVQYNMRFIILAQPGDYPLENVEALQLRYPEHVTVFSTPKQMRQWTVFCRTAADLAFVPSQVDAFGISAAEGLLFGAPVIGTDAGVLKEFLVDRPALPSEDEWRNIHVSRDPDTNVPTVMSAEDYNAYLIGDSLENAIRDASADFLHYRSSKTYREEFVLRMVRSALALRWNGQEGNGPVHEYLDVYKLALSDRQIPELSIHELEEEEALLARLQWHQITMN